MFLIIGLALTLGFNINAQAQTETDTREVKSLLQLLNSTSQANDHSVENLNARLALASKAMVGRPYLQNGPLGEGSTGEYDQDPLYRTDGFDCTTFVETMIALARATHIDDFLDQLVSIRYHYGNIDYVSRNHFVEIDWNPNNQEIGVLRDITLEAFPILSVASIDRFISKNAWYRAKKIQDLSLPNADTSVLNEKLAKLQSEGERFPDSRSTLVYLRKEYLSYLHAQNMPAVLNIIRNINGSPMVTHQVLLLSTSDGPRIYQASSRKETLKVIEQTFEAFLITLLDSPSILGVNVQQILPR